MKDPYQVLGVAKTATDDEIKKVYRRLARELHPDLNPGNARAEERFKEISAAYDFLSDSARRGRFDRGEIDASGNPTYRSSRRPGGAGGGGGFRAGASPFGDNFDDIFSEMMRRKEKGRQQWGGAGGNRGEDVRHALSVSFVEAAVGAAKRVTLISGKAVDVRIPPGTETGQSLRLKGQGQPGIGGDGDAYVDITVEPHPFFTRRDRDVLIDLPVSVQEAVLGGKVTVPTIEGKVTLTVPAGSNTGTVLRLKGRGIHAAHGRGDQLVSLKVVLPEDDAKFAKLVEEWGARSGYDPRARMGFDA